MEPPAIWVRPALPKPASSTANGDAISGVTLASLGAASSANVGTYALSASNAQGTGLSNYNIAYVDASTGLSVTPATLTITATNQSKVYGTAGNLGSTGFTETGLVTANGDAISGVTLASLGAASARKCRNLCAVGVQRAGFGPVELQHQLCRRFDRPQRHPRDADDHGDEPVQGLWNLPAIWVRPALPRPAS